MNDGGLILRLKRKVRIQKMTD